MRVSRAESRNGMEVSMPRILTIQPTLTATRASPKAAAMTLLSLRMAYPVMSPVMIPCPAR